MQTAVAAVWFSVAFVCLFYRKVSEKLMQLGSSNFTQKCFTESPVLEVRLFFGQKVTSHKNCRRGCVHSCECWLLLVATTVHDTYISPSHY